MNHLPARRDWLFERDAVAGAGADADAAMGLLGTETPDESSTTALRTQTTDGKPSNIFGHVRPSSREPNSRNRGPSPDRRRSGDIGRL